jgi:hypothetical protein
VGFGLFVVGEGESVLELGAEVAGSSEVGGGGLD